MNVMVIGSGGREHALVWKLLQSKRVTKVFCAPGNAGTAAIAQNLPGLKITDADGLLAAAEANSVDFTVVGPDDALAAGVVDRFQQAGKRIFGPTRSAARLESSKSFCKDFLCKYNIPTAKAEAFDRADAAKAFCRGRTFPLVLKADGLATGKGVVIAQIIDEAEQFIDDCMVRGKFGESGKRVLIEDFLEGPECSLHVLIDGRGHFCMLPVAQDYKRLTPDPNSPNTGGMGTVSPPVRPLGAELELRIREEIVEPIARGLLAEGIEFRGMLFPGLMLTAKGPYVLELNARFGDPETQVLLPRIKTDLLDLLEATVDGRLDEVALEVDPRSVVCVILASEGYPASPKVGREIQRIAERADDVVVFHAGTVQSPDGKVMTSGGRVFGVSAVGRSREEARRFAYRAAGEIQFEGKQARQDIAAES